MPHSFRKMGIPRRWWGGPPARALAPSSRFPSNSISILQGPAGRPGHRPRTTRPAPPFVQSVRPWENYVALAAFACQLRELAVSRLPPLLRRALHPQKPTRNAKWGRRFRLPTPGACRVRSLTPVATGPPPAMPRFGRANVECPPSEHLIVAETPVRRAVSLRRVAAK